MKNRKEGIVILHKQRKEDDTLKREAGVLTEDGEWLVVVESPIKNDNGYIHKCGTKLLEKKFPLPGEIVNKEIALPLRYAELNKSGKAESITVLYCPRCENEPTIDRIISGDPLVVFW